MKIIIVGCGKVGSLLASYMSKEGQDVVAVDKDADIINDVVNTYDIMGIVGNGASGEVLEQAGITDADLFVAVTASDEVNILCCMIGKKLGAKHTIARVREPVYSQQISTMKVSFGIDVLVNPEFDTAKEILKIIQFPQALCVDSFANGKVDLAEIKIGENHPLCKHKLKELTKMYNINILVCAVRRGDEVIVPSGSFVLEAGDIVHITASHSDLVSSFKELGISAKRIKTVMIVGGGRIAYFLAKLLMQSGIKVKIIEKNKDTAFELADKLADAMIINEDGTDSDALVEEGIDNVDAFVALTGVDEQNIIMSMFAQTRNVDKVITKINHLNMEKMLSSIGLESIVSPRGISSNNIIAYTRALDNSGESSIETLYKIVDGKAEAIEFVANEGFGILSKPLREIKRKPNILIACIIRKGKIIYPHGDDTIEAGDRVIVIAKSEEALTSLKDILA